MTPEERDDLVIAFIKALQQARSVSDSEHYDHHRWIVQQIEREKERARFWRQLSIHVARAGAWSLVTVVGYALYLGVRQLLLRTP